MPKTNVNVKLIGTDGNVFSLIGKVSQALKRAGHRKEAKEFSTTCMNCETYDKVLQCIQEYVEIE